MRELHQFTKALLRTMSEQNVYPIWETAAGFFGRGEDSKSEKEMHNWVPSAENEIEMKWNWLFYYVIVTFRAKQLLHHGWRRCNRDPFPSHKDCNEGRTYIKQNWMLCWHYDKGMIYCRPTFHIIHIIYIEWTTTKRFFVTTTWNNQTKTKPKSPLPQRLQWGKDLHKTKLNAVLALRQRDDLL